MLFNQCHQLRRPPFFLRFFRFNSTSATVPPAVIDQHFVVGPNGESLVNYTFRSEALGMPASQNFGWARLNFGQKIGPSERYTIERKLGWGMHSSIWLARDTVATKFVAIKVLTGMCRKGIGREPEVLRVLKKDGAHTPHCVRLLETFELPGTSVAEAALFPLSIAVTLGPSHTLRRGWAVPPSSRH